MKEATSIAEQTKNENQKLAEEAKTLGAELQDTEIPCEVDPALGFTVEKMVFATVNATENLCNIMLKGDVAGGTPGTVYILMLNEDGEVVSKTLGSLAEGAVRMNLRITTEKGPDVARTYAAVSSIKIVTESEYKTGKAAQPSNTDNATAETVEPEANTEPEPAYAGDESAGGSESVTVDGVTIAKGAKLAETLKKFNKITWDYNADFGVSATVGNVWITIDDSDLTQQGQDVINAIPSDMENDIAFSVDYIKPSATIKNFEAQ